MVLSDDIDNGYLLPNGLAYKVIKRQPYVELPNLVSGMSKVSVSAVKLFCKLFNREYQYLTQYPMAAFWDVLGSVPVSEIPVKLLALVINKCFPNDTEETKKKIL